MNAIKCLYVSSIPSIHPYSLSYTVQFGELSEEGYQSAFAESIGERGVEGQRRKLRRKNLDPLASNPAGNQVALVQYDDEVFVGGILLDVLLHVQTPRSRNIPGIHHLQTSKQTLLATNSTSIYIYRHLPPTPHRNNPAPCTAQPIFAWTGPSQRDLLCAYRHPC